MSVSHNFSIFCKKTHYIDELKFQRFITYGPYFIKWVLKKIDHLYLRRLELFI